MNLESSKTLGGVGTILVIVGSLGLLASIYAGLLILIGAILVLIALKGFSDQYRDASIFNNALYGFITVIIGGVAFIVTVIVVVFAAISDIKIDWRDAAAVQRYFSNLDNVWGIIAAVIAALFVLFIFFVVSAIFFRKSLNSLSAKSGEKIFETAGLLWLIGAVLTIIFFGLILILIAWILMAVGFFSIKTTAGALTPKEGEGPPPPPP